MCILRINSRPMFIDLIIISHKNDNLMVCDLMHYKERLNTSNLDKLEAWWA